MHPSIPNLTRFSDNEFFPKDELIFDLCISLSHTILLTVHYKTQCIKIGLALLISVAGLGVPLWRFLEGVLYKIMNEGMNEWTNFYT